MPTDIDWSEIDPSILGTLFERGLDPEKRSQLGAHYTDRDKIMRIVEPVVVRPWLVEWEAERMEIAGGLERAVAAQSQSARTRAHESERSAQLGRAGSVDERHGRDAAPVGQVDRRLQRFSRRSDLPEIIPRLGNVALRTPRIPKRILGLCLA